MSVKVVAFQAENVKRIKAVSFTLEEKGLTIIGGDNQQGKTSILDTLAWLFGGAKFAPSNPQNAESLGNPYAKANLSTGLIVERSGKNSSLKVTDPSGKKGGQELLNEFISTFALDLPKFMAASDKEKAYMLLDTLGIKEKLSELESKEKALYDERTEIGRVALSLKKHAEELPFYHDAPETELSATTIIEKQQEAVSKNNSNAEKRRKLSELTEKVHRFDNELEAFDFETPILEKRFESEKQNRHASNQEKINRNSKRIKQLEEEIANLRQENARITVDFEEYRICAEKAESERRVSRATKRNEAVSVIKSLVIQRDEVAKEVSALAPDIDLATFKSNIEDLENQNAKYRANIAHDKAASEAKAKETEYDEYTKKIEHARREILALLSSVKMPLPGLTVKDALLYYNGQPWDCMSGSEQLIVGTSIVREDNPECGFVLIDKLEAMDLKTLEKFNNWALQENLQVIATRVSRGNECTIIIEDGCIAKED